MKKKDIWIETKPAWDEQVLVKEAYDEVINHPEEGHWVCNGESQEPDQKPEQPENPDQKPEQPENPDQSRNSQRTQIRNRNSQRIQM